MEKLYYSQPECTDFEARVLACEETAAGWEIALDRTAFYPGGGGQPCDLGRLNGLPVLSMRERDGEIWHCLEQPLRPGETVRGEIDGERRRDCTEQHTADHVLTGVIHRKYGFSNVGFHMGAETTVVDLDGWLGEEALAEMEAEANAVIRADLPVRTLWPTPAEAAALNYRSKKEVAGPLRLISIPGVDLCACCGTHLPRTGGLGLLKIVSWEKLRGGLRLELVAGGRAWRWAAGVFAENRRNSERLSAPPLATAEAVQRLLEERDALRQTLAETQTRWLEALARAYRGAGDLLLFLPELAPETLARLADRIAEACGGLCAAFAGDDTAGYRYVLAQRDGDLRALVKEMNATLHGRGGGKPFFVQGALRASRAAIEGFFAPRGNCKSYSEGL